MKPPFRKIAIDGHSSCGKSTLARQLAGELGFIYIDTGAMYRGVTLFCQENGLIPDGQVDVSRLIPQLPGLLLEFRFNPSTANNDLFLNGRNVEEAIRGMAVSANVSLVSTIREVRERMVELQRRMGEGNHLVMDGRDIGTVVFPDADLKLFVTADDETRAKRRFDELTARGQSASMADILANIRERDHIDQTRAESPLRRAEDAILLDNSNLDRQQQLEWALELVRQRNLLADEHQH